MDHRYTYVPSFFLTWIYTCMPITVITYKEMLHLSSAAVTWLKYCRYGVKRYPINQSINQSFFRMKCLLQPATKKPISISARVKQGKCITIGCWS